MKYSLISCLIITSIFSSLAQDWNIESTRAIIKTEPVSYNDNIEMAGKKVAGIITYDVDSLGVLSVDRQLIFPQLRKYIQDNDNKWAAYRAYLKELWKDDVLPIVFTDEKVFNPGHYTRCL